MDKYTVEELLLREQVNMLWENYLRDAQPYIDRLAAIQASRAPRPVLVRVDGGPQVSPLGLPYY